jgi:excisionase family DNA binding protein
VVSARANTMSVQLPDDLVESIAHRAAEIVIARSKALALSPYLTTREAAEYLRRAPQRIHELVCRGELTRHKEGGRLLLDRAEVDALVIAVDGPRRLRSC